MKTVLLSWNPDRLGTWPARERVFAEWRTANHAVDIWNSKSARPRTGDRFVLIRQGGSSRAERGVISLGTVTSDPEEIPHWDLEKRLKGATTNRIGIVHLAMWSEPILTLDELEARQPAVENWSPLSCGELLQSGAADWLFETLGLRE